MAQLRDEGFNFEALDDIENLRCCCANCNIATETWRASAGLGPPQGPSGAALHRLSVRAGCARRRPGVLPSLGQQQQRLVGVATAAAAVTGRCGSSAAAICARWLRRLGAQRPRCLRGTADSVGAIGGSIAPRRRRAGAGRARGQLESREPEIRGKSPRARVREAGGGRGTGRGRPKRYLAATGRPCCLPPAQGHSGGPISPASGGPKSHKFGFCVTALDTWWPQTSRGRRRAGPPWRPAPWNTSRCRART